MADIRLRRPASISFHRRAPRRLDARQAERLASFWFEATARQPHLHNGPTVEARQVEWHRGHCRISWSETTYAQYLWRRALPAEATGVSGARSLYTSVLLTTADGYVVVGQTSDHTSSRTSPTGRIQLPGGTLDPDVRDVRPVTVADAGGVAVRKLREQLGLTVDPAMVRPWMIIEGGEFGDVAVVFELTLGAPVEEVFAAFAGHVGHVGERALPGASSASPGASPANEPPEFGRLVAFPLGGRRIPSRLASDVTGVPRAEVLDPVLVAAGVEGGATTCRAWPPDTPAPPSRRAALAERGRSLLAREPRERRPDPPPSQLPAGPLPAGGTGGRADT